MSKQTAGLLGLLGAVLLFAGDMLLYGHFGSGSGFKEGERIVALLAPLLRLYLGGLLGPLCATLYLVGFWHVYQNVSSHAPWAARLVAICFSVVMVIGGAYHALWATRQLAMRFSEQAPAVQSELSKAIGQYMGLTFAVAAVPFVAASLALLIVVLTGRSNYPRWTALVNPGLLMVFKPLTAYVPGPLGAVIWGGHFNLVFCLFFAVSLATTWRSGRNG
jgi:hypothetical protein